MKQIIISTLFLLFSTSCLLSQDYNIGVRAGLDFATFSGPLETNETFGFKTGFHFGLSYQYNFTGLLGLRAELLYKQTGNEIRYNGPGYYVLRQSTETTYDNNGIINEYLLVISNGYLSVPITTHYKIGKKFEVYGGAYVGFLVSPTASGLIDYNSTENEDGIFFEQSFDYNYYSDLPLGGNTIVDPISLVLADGDIFLLPQIAGAYYQYAEDRGNAMNTLDFGLIAGTSYYFNSGFYTSFRLEFGLTDVTNTNTDRSLISLDEDNEFIFREDRDTNLNFQVSLGFKF